MTMMDTARDALRVTAMNGLRMAAPALPSVPPRLSLLPPPDGAPAAILPTLATARHLSGGWNRILGEMQ